MTRIQTACYALIASAFVLTGLLLVNLGSSMDSEANAAGLIIARDNFTLMTAQTRESEQALFVLDNGSGKLLVYRLDLGRKQLQLSTTLDVGRMFTSGNTGR